MTTLITTHKNSLKYIITAFSLTMLLMIGQFIAAYFANSLAMFADTGHLLVHNGSLMIALTSSIISFQLAKKKSDNAEVVDIIGGTINAIIFLSIAVIITVHGFERLHQHNHATSINPVIMALTATIAFCVHCLSAYILSKGRKHSFNIHAIFLHTFFDCISTILTFTASIVIFFTGFNKIDSIVSIIIATLIAFSGLRLLKKCAKKALNIHKERRLVKNIQTSLLANFKHIVDIHEQEINFYNNKKTYAAHIVFAKSCANSNHYEECLSKINQLLNEKFDINDTMLQIEYKN